MTPSCYLCGLGSGLCDSCRRIADLVLDAPLPAETWKSPVEEKLVEFEMKPRTFFASVGLDKKASSSYGDAESIKHLFDLEIKTIAEVEQKGFEVIRARSNQLNLDLDNVESVSRFNEMIVMVSRDVKIEKVRWWFSKSGRPHVHAHVILGGGHSCVFRLMLEVTLGSDPKRGILNFRKFAVGGDSKPSLLFRPPGADMYVLSESPFQITW